METVYPIQMFECINMKKQLDNLSDIKHTSHHRDEEVKKNCINHSKS